MPVAADMNERERTKGNKYTPERIGEAPSTD